MKSIPQYLLHFHEIDVLRWLLGENYVSAEVRYGKATSKARPGLHDPQVMIISKGKLVASDTPDKLEKLVQGTETVEIATRAGESAVKEILKTVDGVSDYKVGKDDDGNTTAVIEAEENAEIAEKIFFAFAEKKTALRKLNETKASLEDVFLELTKSEAEDTAPEAAKPDKKALPEDAEDADDKEEEEATDDESDL